MRRIQIWCQKSRFVVRGSKDEENIDQKSILLVARLLSNINLPRGLRATAFLLMFMIFWLPVAGFEGQLAGMSPNALRRSEQLGPLKFEDNQVDIGNLIYLATMAAFELQHYNTIGL